jgi:cytochrome b561
LIEGAAFCGPFSLQRRNKFTFHLLQLTRWLPIFGLREPQTRSFLMPTHYSRTQIILHWAVVALIALQFIFPDAMSEAWRAFARTGEKTTTPMVAQHALTGLLIAALVLWRLVLRFTRGVPPLPKEEPALMQKAAHIAHYSLYALMIAVPLSGMAAWGGEILAAGDAHDVLKTLLMLLIILHVAAALFHQFVLKTNLMARMKRAG